MKPNTAESGKDVLESGGDIAVIYQVAAQHWAHAEQIRWTLLYNFLMASSILGLAWAAIFTGASTLVHKHMILISISFAGMSISVAWFILMLKANGFVHKYDQTATQLEVIISPEKIVGPFCAIAKYRSEFNGFERQIGTRAICPSVVAIFGALYLSLFIVSL